MNKVFRIIWSRTRNSFVVVSEVTTAAGRLTKAIRGTATLTASTLFCHAAHGAPGANELPTGGHVVSGQAGISQSANAMTVQQGSDKAIINWNTFNIGSQASVNFQQPSSASVALNRVIGGDASAIYGSLTANGQVYLVNPNGVLFAPGAQVNVGGLVASSLNIGDEDFLQGKARFAREGATGSVVNQGTINAQYVALLAPEVVNEGIITARMGSVAMAAGETVSLDIAGNKLIGVQVEQASIDTLVENKHLVQAEGGDVIMSARSAYELLGQVVNSGSVEAQGMVDDGGVVRLLASSTVEHSGAITVDGGSEGKGGEAILLADLANAKSETRVSGSLSARGGATAGDGGFVETSANQVNIADSAKIDTRASNGRSGTWLIDPDDFTVAAAGGNITGATLSGLLDNNNVTIQTTATAASCTEQGGPSSCGNGSPGNGDIFINDSLSWSGGTTTLFLEAYRDIHFNASVDYSAFGAPGLEITYGTGGSGKAVVAAGVDMTNAGFLLDTTNFQLTDLSFIDNATRDYWLGTVNRNVYVQLLPGSGTYGTGIPSSSVAYYDAAGGNRININEPGGTAAWSSNPATLNVGTHPLTYASGLTSDYYSGFVAGDPSNWTITPRAIALTANDRSKTYGDALTLGNTAFSITSGSLANGDGISGATLASLNGYSADPSQAAGNYLSEITISNATGTGGFNSSNYAISYVAGDLTINKATLTYTADLQSITKGSALPTFTGSIGGFRNGETTADLGGAAVWTSSASSSGTAGQFAINGGGYSSSNYDFVQAAGNAKALTITEAANNNQRLQQTINTTQRRLFSINIGDPICSTTDCAEQMKKDLDAALGLGSRNPSVDLLTQQSNLPRTELLKEMRRSLLKQELNKLAAENNDPNYRPTADEEASLNSRILMDLKNAGFTAKDFKEAGFGLDLLLVGKETIGSKESKITRVIMDMGDMQKVQNTKTTTRTTTSSQELAFSRDELLGAGYSATEIDEKSAQVAAKAKTTEGSSSDDVTTGYRKTT